MTSHRVIFLMLSMYRSTPVSVSAHIFNTLGRAQQEEAAICISLPERIYYYEMHFIFWESVCNRRI